MSIARSRCLVSITVTALDESVEPRDHKIPFIKQKEALPDYQILVSHRRQFFSTHLEAKIDQSALEGLTWDLPAPISVKDITSLQLRHKDKVVSDALAEVSVIGDTIEERGYRFDFSYEQSVAVGFDSFFDTPVGKAILTGIGSSIVLLVSLFVRGRRSSRIEISLDGDV
ncbi:MAG: hypothetical protein CMJ78_18825 [Planctomycetaceae bacterium]|nr:hypothetical protein [Planctomycetaceae bacterium]